MSDPWGLTIRLHLSLSPRIQTNHPSPPQSNFLLCFFASLHGFKSSHQNQRHKLQLPVPKTSDEYVTAAAVSRHRSYCLVNNAGFSKAESQGFFFLALMSCLVQVKSHSWPLTGSTKSKKETKCSENNIPFSTEYDRNVRRRIRKVHVVEQPGPLGVGSETLVFLGFVYFLVTIQLWLVKTCVGVCVYNPVCSHIL